VSPGQPSCRNFSSEHQNFEQTLKACLENYKFIRPNDNPKIAAIGNYDMNVYYT
jgi:hypothetical protein